MQLKKLFEMQRELDAHINREHELEDENLIGKKVAAFVVESSELANELRFFKYWSNKGPSNKEIILEEYVDGLHFLLSLGNEIGADSLIEDNFIINYVCKADLTEEFIHIIKLAIEFKEVNTYQNYRNLLNRYLSLSKILGFTTEEVVEGYFKKNAINHKRQESGY